MTNYTLANTDHGKKGEQNGLMGNSQWAIGNCQQAGCARLLAIATLLPIRGYQESSSDHGALLLVLFSVSFVIRISSFVISAV
jgi:hypothetical protein